ncbi:MAG: single-stranded DNA-binding protein [Nitrospirae bacterium CG22_combo_CG10-13_8_21_14_all_44_11]|nr:single-stranded DNA-binding protein [Nitrospirota bacterium]OIO32013.1 MAG: single-stranded DNA-binding protein [Nitrospirae bacterium CG1_02_44_142]PIP71191.1 MAG: single-stranded DNA-binding protein [Nitrospirae bacterium CG22_combo_CG10-13_8_21_14_all_44_11]PIW88878.1 MAG: single-stranded DNA-binding protein [Nitrospirae bacterium CG_4_8_14_3_um_filter_44_28]PJA82339.1 MAG: single-stranded DNA-binding protein [Nitrospirae bacterium CG_4_9_14_3_um_filter_44_28]
MFNKIILIGNLTKDPELRYTPQGTAVASFRIAVNSKIKQHGELKDDVLFIGVVVFGKQAESAGQYLSKGKSVLVEGRLQERSWEKDGQKHSKMEVVASSVRFLSRKTPSSSEEAGGESAPPEDIAPPEETTDLEPF